MASQRLAALTAEDAQAKEAAKEAAAKDAAAKKAAKDAFDKEAAAKEATKDAAAKDLREPTLDVGEFHLGISVEMLQLRGLKAAPFCAGGASTWAEKAQQSF